MSDQGFIGAIARCRNGRLGLITGYNSDNGVWLGKHLESDKYGKRWQSKHPQVVGIVYEDYLVEVVAKC